MTLIALQAALALRASGRTAFRFACLLAALCAPLAPQLVQAGDRALLALIGYSPDGRFFAFEEFGLLSGSNLPYSNIHVVDLQEDRFVVGSPVNEQGSDETISVIAVRAQALASAEPRLADLGITRPAELVALNGDGAAEADRETLSFGTPLPNDPSTISGNYEVSLETFETDAAATCGSDSPSRAQGFALTVESEGSRREMHRDTTLTRTRGCPVSYRLYGIALPFGSTDISGAVALVSAYLDEPTGTSRRFVAISLGR